MKTIALRYIAELLPVTQELEADVVIRLLSVRASGATLRGIDYATPRYSKRIFKVTIPAGEMRDATKRDAVEKFWLNASVWELALEKDGGGQWIYIPVVPPADGKLPIETISGNEGYQRVTLELIERLPQ